MFPWHRVSVVDTQSGIGKLLTSFSWNLLIAKILYSLSKCKSCRLPINNCAVLSMLVAEIKWKQMNFTCQNKLVFVFLSYAYSVSNYVRSRACRDVISGTHIYTQMDDESHQWWIINSKYAILFVHLTDIPGTWLSYSTISLRISIIR